MSLYYFPFWIEPWHDDYSVQSLPRYTRLIFYDLLVLLWKRDLQLANDDDAISHYLRITLKEWEDAKELLLKADLIQLVQAKHRVDCKRLGMEYDRVINSKFNAVDKAKKAAKKRWEK